MVKAKPRRPSRRPLLVVAAVLLIGALAAAGYWWWPGQAKLPAPPVVDDTGVDPAVRRAVEAARQAVLQSPESVAAWGKLGMILQAHGLPQAAAQACFTQAEHLDPRQPRWPYYQALALVFTDPEAAIPKLQRAVALCDCAPDVPRLQLGEMLLDRGRLDEASEHFQRVLRHDPQNARASLDLARVAFERGQFRETIAQLERSLEDAHTRKAAHNLLAQTYERLADPSRAEQELRRANELPNDAPWPDPFWDEMTQVRVGKQASLARADRLLHQGRYREALQFLKRLVQDYPDAAWAWVMIGRAYQGMNDYPAMEESLRKAVELGPQLPEAQFYLGVAYFFQKRFPAATACFRKAIELKPDFALAHYNLGHSLNEQGDQDAAVAEFQTAINCNPADGKAHFNLAKLLLKKGQPDLALVHLRHAVQLNPSNQEAKNLLEKVRKQGGD